MSTGVIRISAALFALALLVGVFGLNTQPTQAVSRVAMAARWASVPAARTYTSYGRHDRPCGNSRHRVRRLEDAGPLMVLEGNRGALTTGELSPCTTKDYTGYWLRITGPATIPIDGA